MMKTIEKKAAQRRAWRDDILLHGAKCLDQASQIISGINIRNEQMEVARLAVEIAKLNGSTDAVQHTKHAARLLTEARKAIWFEKVERPRQDHKELKARLQKSKFESMWKPHPYIEGRTVHPDMAVQFAYVFSDGTETLPPPPAKLPNGKKPKVPLRKGKTELCKLLRRVVIAAGGEGLSEEELKERVDGWLDCERGGWLPLRCYEQILSHVDAAERDRTTNARLAKELKRAAKEANASARNEKVVLSKKLVKKNRSKK